MSNLPEPVKVSPTIKLFRYAFLIAGIFYGASKLKAFQIKESFLKEERERKKAERDAKLVEEKRAAAQRDFDQIVAIFSPKPEPNLTVEEQSYSKEGKDSINDNQKEATETVPKLANTLHNTCEFDNKNMDQREVFSSGNTEQCDIFSNTINLHENESAKDYPSGDIPSDFISSTETNATNFDDATGNNTDFGKTSTNDAYFSDSVENNTPFDRTAQSNTANLGETTENKPSDVNNTAENHPEMQNDQKNNGNDIDGYFIQTFPDGIPYIGTDKEDTYHYPKSRSE